jgi:hypothetical protein
MALTQKEASAIYDSGEKAVVEVLCAMSGQIDVLKKQVIEFQEKIAKLNKTSRNSSKRPSSDDITKPLKNAKQNQEKQPDKKRQQGGQPGHPKHEHSKLSDAIIDAIYGYGIDECPTCGDPVLFLFDEPPRTVQRIELKEIVIHTEEHQGHAHYCEHCDEIHYAPIPDDIKKAGLFDAQLTALVAYMCRVCHASFSTVRKFLRDIIGVQVSRGYLAKLIQKVSQALEQPYEELLEALPLETCLNVDETGHKENGERFWTWVFRAELYVLFRIDKSRGSQVILDVLGEEFDGVLGCDYFSAYRKYMKDCSVTVQFCLAHLIRDIRFLSEHPDPATKIYGCALLDKVKKMFHIIHDRENMSDDAFQFALEQSKAQIIDLAIETAPSELDENGKEQKNAAQNMAKRFIQHGKAYFTFITSPGVEPTNNLAEQAIRFIVIDRHITQGTRSIRGRQANERLWSVIGTCALQGRSAYEFILQAVQAFFHNQPAPSLLTDGFATCTGPPN